MSTRFLTLFFLMLGMAGQATASQDLPARADALKLAEHPYWRLLLRYEKAGTASGWRSSSSTPLFFVSPQGRDNPKAELQALLAALSQPVSDEAPICRFPARTAWLREQLGEAAIPRAACPAFTAWEEAIKPHQATLVFAADYLNSPSSMFGHSFLRLDRADQTEDTRLLAYALNYAANATDSNPLAFAWKGLTGGYPGLYSLTPYYEKVKEYSDMESRDLWEYQLSFSPAELHRLLQHTWELRRVEFPYFFLTRNCSYELLALFEVARPGLALQKDFPVQAIPVDTVRRVLAEPGLLRQVVYRPSAQRKILVQAEANGADINRQALRLARSPDSPPLPDPAAEAAALETAYDFRYYQFLEGDQTPEARQDLRQLLVRRASVNLPDQRPVPATPATDPARGHDTARVGVTLGHDRGESYVGLRLRPAYHDLLDIPGGYRHGARIDVLDAEVRLGLRDASLRLEQLNLLRIESLTPRDPFFKPWSWFMGGGLHQAAVDNRGRFSADNSHVLGFVEGGAGALFTVTPTLGCYAQLGAIGETGGALAHGWRLGAGPRLGCLYQQNRWRLQAQTDGRYFNSETGLDSLTTLEGQWDLAPGQGLRLRLGERRHDDRQGGFIEAGWLHYF